MSGHNLISAEQAKELLSGASKGQWLAYMDDFGAIANVGPIVPGVNGGLNVTEADASIAAAAPDLAHTVIAQAGRIAMLEARYVKHHEQIAKNDLSIEGLKTIVEVNQSLIDSTVEIAGLSHMVQEDGDGDWSTIWDLIWQKLEAHKTQAEALQEIAQLRSRILDRAESAHSNGALASAVAFRETAEQIKKILTTMEKKNNE